MINWIRQQLLKFLAIEIQRTRSLEKGDIIFIKFSEGVSVRERMEQLDNLTSLFPDNTVTYLFPGVEIEIVHCKGGKDA